MSECMGPVRVGQMVPDFTMTTFEPSTGAFGTYDLAKNKKEGRWSVLVFYPADFTFVCATEFAALAEVHAELKELGAEVATVSTDTQYTHLAWQREEKDLASAKFAMAADRTGKISKMFGVFDEGSGLALRGTFLISPEGKLANSEVNFYNLGRNMHEIVRRLRANVFLAKHGDQVCPAQWNKEGDKTLKPSAALVGRVHQARS